MRKKANLVAQKAENRPRLLKNECLCYTIGVLCNHCYGCRMHQSLAKQGTPKACKTSVAENTCTFIEILISL